MQQQSLFARVVRTLDARLRRWQGIYEFCEDPVCIWRLSLARARAPMTFADGTTVAPGDLLAVIHFWNERIPPVPPAGPDMAWARQMYQTLVVSLRLLAQYLAGRPELAGVRAVGGEAGFFTSAELESQAKLFQRLGFELWRPRATAGLWWRFAEFWQNVYSWALINVFNPGSLRGKNPLTLERCQIWIPRARLIALHGARQAHEAPDRESAVGAAAK